MGTENSKTVNETTNSPAKLENGAERGSQFQFDNVRKFWAKVEPHSEQIGKELYERLFTEHIEYRVLFRNTSLVDMPNQLTGMIGRILEVGSIDKMMLKLCALGQVHAHKKVPPEAFDDFVQCLVKSIRSVLAENGERVTKSEVNEFCDFYGMISQALKDNMVSEDQLDVLLPEKEAKENSPQMDLNEAVTIFHTFWSEKVEKAGKVQKIGKKFYSIFFTSHPEYARIFHGDIKKQASVLMRMISMFNAEGVEKFATHYDKIVEKHTKLGLTRKHFSHFGQSLIVTLKMELGSEFTAEEVIAFRKVYRLLAMPMEVAIERAYGDLKKKRTINKPRPTLRSSLSGSRDGFV